MYFPYHLMPFCTAQVVNSLVITMTSHKFEIVTENTILSLLLTVGTFWDC